MATLKGSRFWHGHVKLTPVMPSLDGPRNAYDVTVREGEQVSFQHRYTTYAGTPDGHWEVWRLFRALQQAERMADMTTTLNITGRRRKRFNESPLLNVDVGWLHMVMWSDTLTHTHGWQTPWIERRCKVFFYFQEGKRVKQGAAFRQFIVPCRPQEAVQFGKDLETECREALRLRYELGLLAPADDYIDT